MRVIRLVLTLAVLLSPAVALADCALHEDATPAAAQVAETQPVEQAPAATCADDAKGCPEPQASGDRQLASTTDERPATAPRQ